MNENLLTKRQREALKMMREGWVFMWIDAPRMCGSSPALTKGNDVIVLRRSTIDALLNHGFAFHPSTNRVIHWDRVELRPEFQAPPSPPRSRRPKNGV